SAPRFAPRGHPEEPARLRDIHRHRPSPHEGGVGRGLPGVLRLRTRRHTMALASFGRSDSRRRLGIAVARASAAVVLFAGIATACADTTDEPPHASVTPAAVATVQPANAAVETA